MKIPVSIMLLFISFFLFAFQQDTEYQLFDGSNGKEVSLKKMVKRMRKADVILFGEIHNLSVNHQVELATLEELYQQKDDDLLLGAEMFEADNQLILDEYLGGIIEEEHLIEEAKTWKNYKTDYAPLVNFAKDKGVAFVATNIPRRYARLVAKEGLEALGMLSAEALTYCAPLPIIVDLELPAYKQMMTMMEGHMGPQTSASRMVYAQAVKDATMAHFIISNLGKGKTLLHFNGSYHSNNYQGIVHYLLQFRPGIKVATINTVQQDDLRSLEKDNLNTADFILVLTGDTPKSY